jgi:hypothetical protein
MPSGSKSLSTAPAEGRAKGGKEKVRNEEVRAWPQNVINKYDHHSSSKSAVPVMRSQHWKVTLCMPSGSTILSTAPCGWEGKEREKDKVRKEESGAAGRQNVLNKYEHHSSSYSAVPVRPVQFQKLTVCMPSGSTILSTAPAKGKARRGKIIN